MEGWKDGKVEEGMDGKVEEGMDGRGEMDGWVEELRFGIPYKEDEKIMDRNPFLLKVGIYVSGLNGFG